MDGKQKLADGKVQSFWLGSEHIRALCDFQCRYKIKSRGAALRKVLEVVAESEELQIDEKTET